MSEFPKWHTHESKEKTQKAIIISGFPGIGKTTFFNNNTELEILDSDSSNFSWLDKEKKIRNPNFPGNYLKHIRNNSAKADVILVSSHDVVRNALVEEKLNFTLIYPSLEMKDEYIQRYVDRGSDKTFIKLLESNYEKWINELNLQEGCSHVVLGPTQYLADVMQDILTRRC